MADNTYKLSDLGEIKDPFLRMKFKHQLSQTLNYVAPEIIEEFGKNNFKDNIQPNF